MPTLDHKNINELIKTLRSPDYYEQIGGLFSQQRFDVIEYFLNHSKKVEVEDLWLEMTNSHKKISLACVRTSLNWLVEQKIAIKTKNEQDRWEYSSIGA